MVFRSSGLFQRPVRPSYLLQEDVAGNSGDGDAYTGHFRDHRDGKYYDVQYIQVAWSMTKSYGRNSSYAAWLGYMIFPLVHLDRPYFSEENMYANGMGLYLGELGALNFDKFSDFVKYLCPDEILMCERP